MLRRHAIVTALSTWGLILAAALGLALYRHDVSTKSVIEYVWGTSFAFAFIGYLCRKGAAQGDGVGRTESVTVASQNREGYVHADNDDAIVGIAFGTVVMLSALVVFGGSLAILYCFYQK